MCLHKSIGSYFGRKEDLDVLKEKEALEVLKEGRKIQNFLRKEGSFRTS